MLAVYLEVGRRRVFASAVEWPGWSRSGKTEATAIESLLDHRDRYAAALTAAGIEVPTFGSVEIVDAIEGDATTDFGAPGAVPEFDRRPLVGDDVDFHVGVLDAGWRALARIEGSVTGPLAKGPHGGGRELDAIAAHVLEAERAYAPKIGVRIPKVDPADEGAVAAFRRTLIDRLRMLPTDTTWPLRAFVRRTAWHALDHAWEIENRSR